MNIVIAPDSFKESLSAQKVAETIAKGFEAVFPEVTCHTLPIADGGEGTLDALVSATQGEINSHRVEDALGRPVMARWGLIHQGKTAVIELAEASGLAQIEPSQRDIMTASTFGTGLLVREALNAGVEKIILCLGGSATNDGGMGIAQALGVQLFDKTGQPLSGGGEALQQLATVDLSGLHPHAVQVEWLLACDVDNPLCGPKGASVIFGPQKGASEQQVIQLDMALGHCSDVIEQYTGQNCRQRPGYGAAGGTALGISLFANPVLQPGIDIVLEASGFEQLLPSADLVITGEGQMDFQTLHGKAPYGVSRMAKKYQLPVIGIAGSLGKDLSGLDQYFDALFDTVRAPQSLADVLAEAESNLFRTAKQVAGVCRIGRQL